MNCVLFLDIPLFVLTIYYTGLYKLISTRHMIQDLFSLHWNAIHKSIGGAWSMGLYICMHRADSYREFIWTPKKFALNYLTWNITEVLINANKVSPENLVVVRSLWENHLHKLMGGPITALQTLDCDWSVHKFIEVNFWKLTVGNQIFKNDFVCIHYHLC